MQMGSHCDALQKCGGLPGSARIRGERCAKGRAALAGRGLGEKRRKEIADGVTATVL